MHKHSIFLFVFLFSLSFSYAMEDQSKDIIPWKKIGTTYNSVDKQHMSLNGTSYIGLEKKHEWRQIGLQFAQRFIGQEYATIITHFFNKNIALSIFTADDQGNYILLSHKKKLFILPIHSNNHKKLNFLILSLRLQLILKQNTLLLDKIMAKYHYMALKKKNAT